MVYNFRVFKKQSPNGKLTLYLPKRDFIDHVTGIEPIDGVLVIDNDYINGGRKVFGQVICSFRYGREEDEVMGLHFQKDLNLVSQQIHPRQQSEDEDGGATAGPTTKMQERLIRKLGVNAVPFRFVLPPGSPTSIMLQPGANDGGGPPCGLTYHIKCFVGERDSDPAHNRSTICMTIRKVQYAPQTQGRQPCTVVRKDFLFSPGDLELDVSLDQQLYYHGERVAVNVRIRNNSNKTVKKIKAMIQQGVDVVLFQNGQYRTTVADADTQEGCPIESGACIQQTIYLVPLLSSNKERRGVALDGPLKKEETNLASTTLLATPEQRDPFGVIISYTVKVKLYLGALGGEVCAELPLILMHPKPDSKSNNRKAAMIHADSQADVEVFRQDTIVDPEDC